MNDFIIRYEKAKSQLDLKRQLEVVSGMQTRPSRILSPAVEIEYVKPNELPKIKTKCSDCRAPLNKDDLFECEYCGNPMNLELRPFIMVKNGVEQQQAKIRNEFSILQMEETKERYCNMLKEAYPHIESEDTKKDTINTLYKNILPKKFKDREYYPDTAFKKNKYQISEWELEQIENEFKDCKLVPFIKKEWIIPTSFMRLMEIESGNWIHDEMGNYNYFGIGYPWVISWSMIQESRELKYPMFLGELEYIKELLEKQIHKIYNNKNITINGKVHNISLIDGKILMVTKGIDTYPYYAGCITNKAYLEGFTFFVIGSL